MPFYKFLFAKGDILVGVIPEHNPCNYSYSQNLYSDTLILTQKCEPFNGEYDTSPMVEVLNKHLYTWAKEIGLHQFWFSIAVRPSFFEKKDK